MSYANRPIPASVTMPWEWLNDLAYELLDAHADTQWLLQDIARDDLSIRQHLDYLRDLQRVGREILARVVTAPRSSHQRAHRPVEDD